jgi:predicted DNA repair protein MutK
LAKSSFPSLKTPTVLSQQELGNPVGKAFANRVGVFANSLALLAKRVFPVVKNRNLPLVFVKALNKEIKPYLDLVN